MLDTTGPYFQHLHETTDGEATKHGIYDTQRDVASGISPHYESGGIPHPMQSNRPFKNMTAFKGKKHPDQNFTFPRR